MAETWSPSTQTALTEVPGHQGAQGAQDLACGVRESPLDPSHKWILSEVSQTSWGEVGSQEMEEVGLWAWWLRTKGCKKG